MQPGFLLLTAGILAIASPPEREVPPTPSQPASASAASVRDEVVRELIAILDRTNDRNASVKAVRLLADLAAETSPSVRALVVSELIAVLDRTKDTDTLLAVVRLLVKWKAEVRLAAPAVVRNAYRLGLMEGGDPFDLRSEMSSPAWNDVVNALDALLRDSPADTASPSKVLRERGAAVRAAAADALDWLATHACPSMVLNQYSPDPNKRMTQLIDQSEDHGSEWIRIWMNDMPSHLTPERIHGGINP